MAAPFENLVQELAKLRGVGRRSAERAALALVRKGAPSLAALEDALSAVRTGVALCARCGAVTSASENPCRLCTDLSRDRARLLVVEEAGDILAIERSGAWNGLYHALGGRISPAAGTGPKDLAVARLEARLGDLFRNLFFEPNPIPGKAAMALLGLMENTLRLPLVPATEATQTLMQQTLEALFKK